jgi:hypothetical protein
MWSKALNPVVVKEVRQGLKSRGFLLGFGGIQLLMVFSMFRYLDATSTRDFRDAHALFWFFLGLPLLALIPLRAFNAVQEERKSKTLELVFLTRLTAWNIVAGKWLALFLQCLLTCVAVLPFLVLRYFLGRVELLDDLLLLLALVLGSALLTALGVVLSATQSRVVRALAVLGTINLLTTLPMFWIGMRFTGMGPALAFGGFADVLWALGWVGLALVFLLEFGASLIAPPAENHARWKRSLALGILAYSAAGWHWGNQAWMFPLSLFVLVLTCLDAICELPRRLPVLYGPTPRPLRDSLFSPGWPSGVFFTLVAAGLVALVVVASGQSFVGDFLLTLPILLGALLFPLPFITRLKRPLESLFTPYFLVQISVVVLAGMFMAAAQTFRSEELRVLVALIPGAALVLLLDDNDLLAVYSVLAVASGVMILLFLLRAMRPHWAAVESMRARARPASPP